VLSLIFGALLTLTGCASYQGGTSGEAPVYFNNSDTGEAYPAPAASSTFRPGMNPEDPRDPHFNTRPQPTQSPPTTQP